MMKLSTLARQKLMYVEACSGKILKDIAATHGVSTERVRQSLAVLARRVNRQFIIGGGDVSRAITSSTAELRELPPETVSGMLDLVLDYNPIIEMQIKRIRELELKLAEKQQQALSHKYVETNTLVISEKFTVGELGLSVRAYNCLVGDRIHFVHDLIRRKEVEIRRLPNMGVKSLNEIKAALAFHDLQLTP